MYLARWSATWRSGANPSVTEASFLALAPPRRASYHCPHEDQMVSPHAVPVPARALRERPRVPRRGGGRRREVPVVVERDQSRLEEPCRLIATRIAPPSWARGAPSPRPTLSRRWRASASSSTAATPWMPPAPP